MNCDCAHIFPFSEYFSKLLNICTVSHLEVTLKLHQPGQTLLTFKDIGKGLKEELDSLSEMAEYQR